MTPIDPMKPIFRLFVADRHIATLFDPQWEEMFWCSYRIEPKDEAGDLVLHDEKTWELVRFVVKDMDGKERNPPTFSGGFSKYVARESDRLSFRSLWPPEPSLGSRVLSAITAWLGFGYRK